MHLQTLLFAVSMVVAAGYALARGGLPERIVAVELTLAAAVTEVMAYGPGFSLLTMEWRVFEVDLLLLVALVPVALYANRYWPLWIAAVQLDTIAVHGVRVYDPALRASVYYVMAGYAAYPILILLAVGTLRHRQRQARAGTGESAWTI